MTEEAAAAPAAESPPSEPPPPEPSPLVAGQLLGFEEHGLAAQEGRPWAYRVAPVEGDDGHATLVMPLRVRASFRLEGVRFAHSFVGPEMAPELRMLVALIAQNPDCPLALFGHADPVGSEEHNKTLSGRRARALYALLVRDVDAWEALHQKALDGDKWGLESLQAMLRHLGYDPGASTGRFTEETKTAIRSFQEAEGLNVDGQFDKATRLALFRKYMDALVVDDAGAPVVVPKERFLGGGADAEGKMAYQGCGELNLRRRPSKDQEKAHDQDKASRDAFHAQNRRVTVVLFEPGTTMAAARWPCPKASEGPEGCKKVLWSDEKKRGTATDTERAFWSERDTFRCRFYQRIHLRTVAEGVGPALPVQVRLIDRFGFPASGTTVRFAVGGVTRTVRADEEGVVRTSMPEGTVTMAVLGGGFAADEAQYTDHKPASPLRPDGGGADAELPEREADDEFAQLLANLDDIDRDLEELA